MAHIYALDLGFVLSFVKQIEEAATSVDSWAKAYDHLARIPEPLRYRFYLGGFRSTLAALDDAMLEPRSLPSAEQRAVVYQTFARWFSSAHFETGEPHLFIRARTVHDERPELADSPEWDIIFSKLLGPDHIHEEVWFLAGNEKNTTCASLDAGEVKALVEAEAREGLLQVGTVGYGADGQSIRALLELAGARGWWVWVREVD